MIDNNKLKELQNELLSIAIDFDDFCKKNGIEYFLMGGSALGAFRHKGFIPWDDDFDVFMTQENYLRFLGCASKELDSNKYFIQQGNSKDCPMFYTKIRKNGTTYLEENFEQFVCTHHGIFIDIFCLNKVSDNPLIRRLQFVVAKMLTAKALVKRGGYKTDSIKKRLIMKISTYLISEKMQNRILSWLSRYETKDTKYISLLFGSVSYKRSTLPIEILGLPKYVKFEDVQLPVPSDTEKYLSIAFGDYMRIPDNNEIEKYSHSVFWDSKKNFTEYIKNKNYRKWR